ncbi:hypothetical protein [Eubacterium ramulus]|uniref:hypothetical protein n=1 Tax=Eubacterium ramulus TaxID=39490 RepID=UPI0022E46980|nr:hypothetical protein [Eubacterium ramulus]
MILTQHEQVIINNMKHPSTVTASKSYKDLSDEELTSLIGKIDDYVNEIGETQRAFGNYDEFYVLEFDSIKARLVDECQRRKIMLRMQGDKFDVYRKEYNEIVNSAMNHPVGNMMYKIRQIKRILMEEFPREANDEKAELVANRLYDQIMYEDKDV